MLAPIAHLALGQIKVVGFPFFQICRTRDGERGLIKSVGSSCLVQLSIDPHVLFEAAVWTGAPCNDLGDNGRPWGNTSVFQPPRGSIQP